MKTNLSIQRSLFLMVIFITSLQATSQVDQRIAIADKYYDAGDYFTAAGLYEQFLNPPKKEIPKANFPLNTRRYGQGGGGNYPSTGPIYGGGHPGNALPPAGSIGTLPVFPFDPTRPSNELPGDQPGMDNSLPGQGGRPSQPIQLHPGLKLVVKYMACHGFIAVPDNELPQTPEPK